MGKLAVGGGEKRFLLSVSTVRITACDKTHEKNKKTNVLPSVLYPSGHNFTFQNAKKRHARQLHPYMVITHYIHTTRKTKNPRPERREIPGAAGVEEEASHMSHLTSALSLFPVTIPSLLDTATHTITIPNVIAVPDQHNPSRK